MSQSKTPKIRFPEFTEDWQKKRLDEIFTERKESCIISEEYPQLAFTIAEGVINPEDKKTNKRDFLIKDIETKKFAVTEVDDIIYNPANLKFGAIHRNKLKRGGVSPIYAIFSTEQLPAFMEYLVKRPSFIQESLKYLEGTVIKLMTLKPRDFLLMKTYIPSIPEQEKIADLFTTLDSYIEIETKKTDSYKTLKASMLQKMLPQQGTSEPEIRFPGFTEPWEQRKLLEFGKATGGTSIESEFSEDGIYKVISIGSYSEDSVYRDQGIRAVRSDKTANRILNKGDITMILNDKTASGNIIGRVLLIEESGVYVYNQRTERIEVDSSNYDSQFIYTMLNAPEIRDKIIKQSQGNTQIYVNWTTVSQTDYLVPQLSEQRRIGEYFSNLDNLITLHQRKCDTLKELKKGMLQKMFV